MLLLQTVLSNMRKDWGDDGKRPGWLRSLLATNRAHIRRHGYAMVVRWSPRLHFPPPFLASICERKKPERERINCWLNAVRENYNWEKHQAMLEYLNSPENFSHVFVLDADAALVQPEHDILEQMASELSKAGKEIFLTNEDWLNEGGANTRINGGLLFAKNTAFNRALFEDMLDAHWGGHAGNPKPRIGGGPINGCAGNEQMCIGAVQNRAVFKEKMLMKSGQQYNCGAKEVYITRMFKEASDVEIMHFMGASKSQAARILCHGKRDLTGEGLKGYGCAPG